VLRMLLSHRCRLRRIGARSGRRWGNRRGLRSTALRHDLNVLIGIQFPCSFAGALDTVLTPDVTPLSSSSYATSRDSKSRSTLSAWAKGSTLLSQCRTS
jgi:hypothetical protein